MIGDRLAGAEQVGAVAEIRYTRELHERVFQTEEGAA